MKVILKRFLYKKVLLLTFFLSSFFSISYSQEAASSHPVLLAAPHLPKMERYDGIGKQFHGEKYSYKKDANEIALKYWIKTYPDEVVKYKETMKTYMSTINVSELSNEEKELYYDLKSQWYIFRQYVF